MPTSTHQWQQDGHYFTFDQQPFFYRDSATEDPETANKPVLLLIHGFPTSSWDWHKLWSALSQQFRLIAPDMFGFGFSPKPKHGPKADNYHLLYQADMHQALIKHLQLGPHHVLAHDYGVSVAQELLARAEQTDTGAATNPLLSLTFLNGGLFPETHLPILMQKLMLSPLGAVLRFALRKPQLEDGLRKVFGPNTPPSQQELDDFYNLIDHNKGQWVVHKLIRYMPQRRENRERWVSAMQSTRIPMKLINGPADPVSGIHLVERYQELIPQPNVTVLNNEIGHYPQVEDPAQVLAAFTAFTQELASQ